MARPAITQWPPGPSHYILHVYTCLPKWSSYTAPLHVANPKFSGRCHPTLPLTTHSWRNILCSNSMFLASSSPPHCPFLKNASSSSYKYRNLSSYWLDNSNAYLTLLLFILWLHAHKVCFAQFSSYACYSFVDTIVLVLNSQRANSICLLRLTPSYHLLFQICTHLILIIGLDPCKTIYN